MEIGGISQGIQISYGFSNEKNDAAAVQTITATKPSETDTASDDGIKNKNTDVQVDKKELKNALDKLTKFISDDNTKVEYEFHKKFNHDLMIKIINKDTNQVLLEVPPKKILDIVAKMMDMVGVLFDKTA